MRTLLIASLLSTLALPAAAAADPPPTVFPGRIVGSVLAPVPKFKANTVVYVKQGPKAPAAAAKTVTMDQRGLVFIPRVLPIQVGWTVDFLNSDPVAHNVFSNDGEKYDLGTWPAGKSKSYTFKKTGTYRQLCKVHDDMIAYVVVLDTPWFAVSDKAGSFTLAGLPPGSYTLGVWHEKLKGADLKVELAAGGEAKVDVPLQAGK